MDLGLERISQLLAILGQPQRQVPFVHVAGTNGKGSTTAFLASILRQAGFQVGTFTSPHFLHPRDAIRVDGQALSLQHWQTLRQRVATIDQAHHINATEFERDTAVAWLAFCEARVDLAVVECGLGGRLDATNAGHCPALGDTTAKIACVITPIALDHQQLLGCTESAIAAEKAGIFVDNGIVILAKQESADAYAVLTAAASKHRCKIFNAHSSHWVGPTVEAHVRIMRSEHEYIDAKLGLLGDTQLCNVATAVAVVDALKVAESLPELLTARFRAITRTHISEGIAAARWPWRLERLTVPRRFLTKKYDQASKLHVLLDGAHNPAAAKLLRGFVDNLLTTSASEPALPGACQSVTWIFGVGSEKDLDGVLRELLHPMDRLLAVPFSQPIGMPWVKCCSPEGIVQSARNIHPRITAEAAQDVEQAFERCNLWLNGPTSDPRPSLFVVCGSLYLAADVYRWLHRDVDQLWQSALLDD